VLAAELCLEQLVTDPSAEVRRAAAHAAWTHVRRQPSLYAPLLASLASDEDPQVAEIARLARMHT
jgi:vesicle coat complex subunit